jgi:aspartyl-tRNA(Asn)/glutamyl-tRNA(Gln) amidotransferase subunit C
MSLDEATVARIARLARIEIEADQRASLAGELSGILGWIEQLAEVDTENVPPMTSVGEMTLKLRPDEVTDGDKADDVLANAPSSQDGHFVVPKVVE